MPWILCKQECIPVGCVPPALPPYRKGGLYYRDSLDRDPSHRYPYYLPATSFTGGKKGLLHYTGSRLQRVRLQRSPGCNEQIFLSIKVIDRSVKNEHPLVTNSFFCILQLLVVSGTQCRCSYGENTVDLKGAFTLIETGTDADIDKKGFCRTVWIFSYWPIAKATSLKNRF